MKGKGCRTKTDDSMADRDTPPRDDSALFFQDLENRASRYSVQTVRLHGKCQSPLGLLLINNGACSHELASALAGLRFADQPRAVSLGQPKGKLPDLAWLRQQLTMELAQVQQTRLPCALLLITLSGGASLVGQAATALAPYLHPGDLLACFQKNTLGLVMPGASVGKARKRAEEIRTILRPAAFSKDTTLALGIAVCHAYETIPPDQFLALAEAELARAAKMGNDAICQSAAVRSEDSCQVTVEERAQLWMQPRKAAQAAGMAA